MRVKSSVGAALSELVMAWARDSRTGEPRYILELDKSRRGAKCGCECPSCGVELTAVNAAKEEFEVRPHFRHPAGAQRADCLVLVSRAALLRQFEEGGWLELPRHRVSATVTGFSGTAYDAWVEQPAQKLHIRNVSYRDRTQAVVTFDDGRQLLVLLTGESGLLDSDSSGLPIPTISIDVDDPSLASMDREELRRRLRLLPNAVCWRTPWDDEALAAQAREGALREAQFRLDASPDGFEFPPDFPAELRRESVLHYEVKRILVEERRLGVPALSVSVSLESDDADPIELNWEQPDEMLSLDHIEEEQRLGKLTPDVSCKAWPEDGGRVFSTMFIEVAVTNPVDAERLSKIREKAVAAIELDFSRTGGWVNRDELKHLVVHDLTLKRWLYNPILEENRTALIATAEAQIAEIAQLLQAHHEAREHRHAAAMSMSLETLAQEYLEAATAMYDASNQLGPDGRQTAQQKLALLLTQERVADLSDKLALRGYPEASFDELLDDKGILPKILSCKLGRSVGYRVANVMGVLNAMWQSYGWRRSFHSLTFIALVAYKPPLRPEQHARIERWREEVRQSIRSGETTFLRYAGYDRFLALLFPEMAAALDKPGAKNAEPDALTLDYVSNEAHFLRRQPRADSVRKLLDTSPGQWWLRGRDLQAWRSGQDSWAAARFEPLG